MPKDKAGTDTRKTRGRALDARLLPEWRDKRAPEWTPQASPAQWRCPAGHTYIMSRKVREALPESVPGCLRCRAAAAASSKPQEPPAGAAGTAGAPQAQDAAAGQPGAKYNVEVTVDAGGRSTQEVVQAFNEAVRAAAEMNVKRGRVVPMTERVEDNPRLREALGERGEFLVRDLLGRPQAVFSWERVGTRGTGSASNQVAHHVLVLDRSGSMCGDIAGMRDLVRRLLCVEEYRRPGLLVSVVSYSSQGSLRYHVERQPVTDFGDGRVSLAKLEAEGLTCMSDGLEAAVRLTRPSERTTVTLHSDGYCNDPSPASERKRVSELCGQLHTLGAVVNTVAYRPSSDFTFLASVANAGGGACVQAGGLQQVYDALVTAQRGAAGPFGTSVEVPQGTDFAVRVHPGLRRVLCAVMAGRVSSALDDVSPDEVVYFVRRGGYLNQDGSLTVRAPESLPSLQAAQVMLALARGLVGAGRHALAKQVALSTGIVGMRDHARALTGPQVAAFAAYVDAMAFDVGPVSKEPAGTLAARQPFLPQPEPRVTLPELLAVLGRHPGGLRVFLPGLQASYRRRGLKRVPGKWEGGKVVSPEVAAAPRRAGTGSDGWCDLVSVEQNDAEATVNITVAQPVDLVVQGIQSRRLSEVAGVSLENLRQFRSFTVVADGEVCLKSLPCRVVRQALHDDLGAAGAVSEPCDLRGCPPGWPPFDPDMTRHLSLNLPLTRSSGTVACPSEGDVLRVLRLTVLQRLLSASFRDGAGTPYSAEQVAALRAVHVTPALNFSPPTCYPYEDLKKAQAAGQVDSRTRYRVTFGARGVVSGEDLHSGNEYLQRRWNLFNPDDVNPVDKPTMALFFDRSYMLREKTAAETKRLKIGPADELSMPLYQVAAQKRDGSPWPVHTVGGLGSADLGLPRGFGCGASWSDAQARRGALAAVEAALESARARLREAVMVVGASGTIPDEWGGALAVEQVEALGYKVGKAERDGSFRQCGGVLACVVAKESLFSVSWESSSDN